MSNQTIITLTTDFGDDFAIAQAEAVILTTDPNARPFIISNSVKPFSILEGAFMIAQSVRFFPPKTVHIGVVDPGVGTKRQGVIIETAEAFFVGPNNGLFFPALKDIKNVYEIIEKKVDPNHSNTFHGRDVFARAAALITKGEKIESFATPIDPSNLVELKFQQNQIVHIDDYGNIKIHNRCDEYQPGDILEVRVKDTKLSVPFLTTFGNVKPGEVLAYRGSHGNLELALNLVSIAKVYSLAVGDVLEITRTHG